MPHSHEERVICYDKRDGQNEYMNHNDNPPKRSAPYRILRILLIATGTLVAAHLLMQYLNLEVFYQQNGQAYELSNRFDFDDESSVPTWYAQALFLLFGVTALLCAYLEKSRALQRLFGLMGVIALAFSIDEGAGIHEFVLQTIHVWFFADASPTKSNNAWLLVLPLVMLAGLWFLIKIWKLLPLRTITLFVIAGGLFFSGAIFVDLITNTSERETFLNQGIFVAIEESMELFGTVIAIYALVDYLHRVHAAKIRAALRQLR